MRKKSQRRVNKNNISNKKDIKSVKLIEEHISYICSSPCFDGCRSLVEYISDDTLCQKCAVIIGDLEIEIHRFLKGFY